MHFHNNPHTPYDPLPKNGLVDAVEMAVVYGKTAATTTPRDKTNKKGCLHGLPVGESLLTSAMLCWCLRTLGVVLSTAGTKPHRGHHNITAATERASPEPKRSPRALHPSLVRFSSSNSLLLFSSPHHLTSVQTPLYILPLSILSPSWPPCFYPYSVCRRG